MEKTSTPPAGHEVLVVSAHSWGRGKDRATAIREIKKQWSRYDGKFVKENYRVYTAPKGSWVDDFGSIRWNTKDGHPGTICPECAGFPEQKGVLSGNVMTGPHKNEGQ